jgi:hypothetical protein
MIDSQCDQCGEALRLYRSRFAKSDTHFCNKSCHRSFKNSVDNPSKSRDLSGSNNPMFGKHPVAWNKGVTGEASHNWRGGIHTRADGYVRINVNGERKLFHRHLLADQLLPGNVVHHKDHNPSNNISDNLVVLTDQAEHMRVHANERV